MEMKGRTYISLLAPSPKRSRKLMDARPFALSAQGYGATSTFISTD